MSKEQIVDRIEILIKLIKEKEEIENKICKLKDRGKGIMKLLLICSAIIYPVGIMLYMDGESLASAVNIIVDENINNEFISFEALKFIILWSIFLLVAIVTKQGIYAIDSVYIKKYKDNIASLGKKIEQNSLIESIHLSDSYYKIGILKEFKNYLNSGRAYDLKECMNYYEFHNHLDKIRNEIAGKVAVSK